MKCCSGTLRNCLCGLKMHHDSCRVIKGLELETFEYQDINQTYADTGQLDNEIYFSTMLKSSLTPQKFSDGCPTESGNVAKALRFQLRKDNVSSNVSIRHENKLKRFCRITSNNT